MDWLEQGFPFSANALAGKHAVVCGASRGIGAATAKMLASAGCRITAISRNPTALVEQLPGEGHRGVSLDLENQEKVEEFAQSITEVDILINNSAGPPGGPLIDNSVEDFNSPFARHLFAAHTLTKAFVPLMEAANSGRIVNIISTSVREPIENLGLTNTLRGAMAAWSKSMTRELPNCITINNVLPGFTDTKRLESLADSISEKTGKTTEEIHSNWLSNVPINRLIDPRETAAAITFLCLPIAGGIRGVSLAVDGGRMRSI
jgi:3-oxoacyl-[acyl-carrier protein] reductase